MLRVLAVACFALLTACDDGTNSATSSTVAPGPQPERPAEGGPEFTLPVTDLQSGGTLPPSQPLTATIGTHCGVRILGLYNGRWWRAQEALSERADWFPAEWVTPEGRLGWPLAVTLTLDAASDTIEATFNGRDVTYVPGHDLEDWEYCA